MNKKEIKEALSHFDETKIPDKYRILSACGVEYKYEYTEKMHKSVRRMNFVRVAALFVLITLLTCFTTAFATSEQVQELFGYIKVRFFYGDGSYSDKIVGSYPLDGAQTSANAQRPPDGIVPNPDYWEIHQKDVSGYEVNVVNIGEKSITLHIFGGEDFCVYENYVKIERLDTSSQFAEWQTVFERLIAQYGGGTYAPKTDVISGAGDFTSEIETLSQILAGNEAGNYKYRITIKVCSPTGEMDGGDVSAEFTAK
ncbi:MAG: hypothetical protein IJX55_10060 [Clostridia bacterium]|nr:hypothetical protein [Clostridia bacterium]